MERTTDFHRLALICSSTVCVVLQNLWPLPPERRGREAPPYNAGAYVENAEAETNASCGAGELAYHVGVADERYDVKWCDYGCEHAAFPEEAIEGACRTVAAVWCKALKKPVPKNSPCQFPSTRADVKRRREQR